MLFVGGAAAWSRALQRHTQMENQIQQYLSQLIENPQDIFAMDSLERLFGDGERWSELVDSLSQQAQVSESPHVKAGLLVRAAEVTGMRLGNAEAAEGLFRQALEMNGQSDVGKDAQVGLLSLKGDWRSVIELYQQDLSSDSPQDSKVRALCKMGYVFKDRLGDRENALKAFQAAFRLDKTCLVALRAARDMYRTDGKWQLVAQLLQFELQALNKLGVSRPVMAEAYVELGDVLRLHLDNADVARNCYTNALKLDEANEEAARGLRRLDGEPESFDTGDVSEDGIEEAPDVVEAAIAQAAEEDTATRQMEPLERSDEALAEGEDDPATMVYDGQEAEEEAAPAPPEAPPAPPSTTQEVDSAALAAESEAAAEAQEAVAQEAEEAASEEDAAPEVVAEEAVAEEIVVEEDEEIEVEIDEDDQVEEAPADAEQAPAPEVVEEAEVEEEVEEEAPAPPPAPEAQPEELPAPAQEVAEADAEIAPEIEVEEAPLTWQARAASLMDIGSAQAFQQALSMHADRDPAGDGLMKTLAAAIDAAPADQGHYEALRGRFGQSEVWTAVAGAFEGAAGQHDGAAATALGQQAARVKLYELGDFAAATAAADAMGDGAEEGFKLELRDAKVAEGGSWRRLQQEIESRHEGLDAASKASAVYGRVAELARAFGHQDRQLDALRRLNNENPGDGAGRRQLKGLYASMGKWQNCIEMLRQEIDLAEDDQAQLEIYEQMLRIYRDELRQDPMVVTTLTQMLQIQPENLDTMDQLAAQYDKMRRYPDLVGVLRKRADATEDDGERLKVLLQIADLFQNKFSNQAEAIKAFEAILELDPYHPDALGPLKAMYEKRREFEKLIDIHEREIARLDSADEKAARYKTVAELATKRLRNPERAAELWHKVLEFNGGDMEALGALEKLYERHKDWDSYAEICERKLEALGDDPAAIKLAEKLGRIYTDRLKNADAAGACWRRILELDPKNRRAQDSLKRLLIDAQDWDGLAAFFVEAGDHKTHVRTLETLSGTSKDPAVKVELLFRAAEVWRDQMEDTGRAVKALEKVQTIDEGNVRAAQMLVPIYEESGKNKKLGEVLETVLGSLDPQEEPEETRAALVKLASLNETELGNPEVALLYFARAFALTELTRERPEEEGGGVEVVDGAFEDLERVAGALGAWDDLVGVYSDKLDTLQDGFSPEAVRELQLRLGRILNAELGRSEEALVHYEAVLAVFPEELRALEAEEEIFGKLGDWDRLMSVYDRRLALTDDAQARIGIFLDKAMILETQSQDARGAVACYLEVLELEPEHAEALGSLHRLYEELGAYPELAEVIRRELALVQAGDVTKGVDGHGLDEEAAREAGILHEGATLESLVLLKHQLGLVAAEALGGYEANAEAVAAFRDVLAIAPDNEDALMLLQKLGTELDFALEVANILEPFYAETSRWEPLVAAQEVQLEALPEDEVDAREAKLLSIGQIRSGQMGDLEGAFGAYGRALTEKPSSQPALESLSAIAEAMDDWAPLVDLWEDIIARLTEPDQTHAYQTRVAQVVEEHLGDAPRAQDAWRKVLDLEPEDEQALAHLQQLYMAGQQWHELDEIYTRQLAIAESRTEPIDGEVQGLLFNQASLHEDMIDDSAGAIELYQRILDDDARNLRACRAMDRLLGQEGRHDELANNLQQQLDLVEDEEEALELKCRLAALKEGALYQVPEAIELYGQVLQVRPDYAEAIESLDRLLRAEPDHQLAVAAILEPLYENASQWEQLIETLEIRLASNDDPAERVTLLHRIASLYETQLGNPSAAFDATNRALEEDVTNESSMGSLYRLAATTERYEDLVDALEREVAQSMEPELTCDLNMRIAALQEEQLGDVPGATEHYQRVLQIDPEHMSALGHLERIFTQTAQWPSLVDILLQKVPLTEEVADQKALLHRAATLQEDMLEDTGASIEMYERALHIDGADETSIAQLERLYQGTERWVDLIELYRRKLELTEDPEARRELYFLIGGLYEEALEDDEQAIETYRQVLDLDERDGEALVRLDALYGRTMQWHELLETLEKQLALSDEPSVSLGLRHRMGALWEQHLGDPARAIEIYREVLAQAPDFVLTLDALEGMIERGEEKVEAARVLRPIYYDTQQWGRLIELYEILVNSGDDEPAQQAEMLKEIGQIQELRQEDSAAAFTAYGRAMRLVPEDEGVLETLERLAGELEGWESLVILLEDQIGETHDMEVAKSLSLRVARILEQEIFDRPRAIERLRTVLDIEPGDAVALGSLDRLYEQEGRWDELAGILNEEILQEDDEAARRVLRYRLGKVYENALEDIPLAISSYHDILMGDPEHAEAREALEGMLAAGHSPMEIGQILGPWYEEREHWPQLVGVYELQLEHREDPDERFEQLQQIAGIYQERLSSPEQAFVCLGRALAERPGDEATIEALEGLAESLDGWPELAGFYTTALENAHDLDDQRRLYFLIAVIMDQRLGDMETAEEAYLRVLDMDSSDERALEALDKLYEQQARWPELAHIITQEVNLVMDEERVVSLLFRLGIIYETQLGDLQQAVDTYNNLLDIQPMHAEALAQLQGIYQVNEQWEPLFNVYRRQADMADEDPTTQSEIFAQMATLASNMLMRPLDAIDLWNQVLELRGEDPTALASLAQLHYDQEHHSELVEVLERQVKVTLDPMGQAQLWAHIGTIYRDHMLNDERALEAWNNVLQIDPTNVQALYACRDLHQRMGNYEALVEIIDRLIMEDSLDAAAQLDLYVQLGEIQGNLLRNIPEAIKAWTAVLSLDPSHKMALDSLEELYSEGGQWEACVDILDRKVRLLEARWEQTYGHLSEEQLEMVEEDPILDEQIELQLRIADLWESKINNQDMAVSAYEAVGELDPGHMQASRALEALYNERQTWDKLVELYLIRQEYLEDDFEGMEVLRRASQIYEEHLDDKGSAFLVACRAFMLNREDEQNTEQLERLAKETGEWETLINLYYNVLEEAGDGSEAVALHYKIARWWADELGDRDKAIGHYQKAMELDPTNTKVMAALEDIYAKAGRWHEQVNIMRLRAEMTPEDDIRVDLFRKIGDVQDIQLQDPGAAIESYRMILHIDAYDVSALSSLENIYQRQEAWPELIQVLENKCEAIHEPDQVVELRYKIAQLWENQVGSPERAVDAYNVVRSIEPTHSPSLEALERLYRHLERWFELQEVYDAQLNIALDPASQVAIYLKSAQVYEVEIVDVESAVEVYGRVLMVDPHNIAALTELERLYEGLQRWDDLYQTLERHVESVLDNGERVALYHRMGAVCRDHMGDLHRSIEAYQQVLALDPSNVDGLYALAQLYETTNDWESCVVVYETLAEVVDDPAAGVEVHHRMGLIKEEHLGDLQGALERYRFALEIDPSYKPSLDALRGLYERSEDWGNVIGTLRQEEEYTRDLEAKAELLSKIGQIYEHRLGDEIRALDYYEQTIDLAPENINAAEPLSRMYLREQRWARAWPLLDLLVRHYGADRTREDLYMLHYNLGKCCEELGQDERALKEYGESYEFNPNHLPTLMGMARLFYGRNDLDRSYKIFRTITRHHADALSEEQLVDIYLRCGDIKRRLGDLEAAVEMYEAVLAQNPHHKDALRALIELCGELARWDHAVAYRERQLETLADNSERFHALNEMGDILYQNLNNPAVAVEIYRRALEVNPDSVAVLRKLLDIYTNSQMWTDAVAVLARIAELEQDPGRKSKYCYTIAVIFRDEVGDVARSVEFFNRALDNDVSMLKAFEAIDRLLTQNRAWKELERSYRKMLHRVKDMPKSPEMEGLNLLLWKNLGEIYRSRQGNYEAAIEAYKVAVQLRPEDAATHEILADLYERSGKHPVAAIEEHKKLIAMKPFRIESYRALFNAYMKTQRYDEAWCMSSALTFLQSASAKEQEFYQNYLGAGPAQPNRSLTPEHWKLLYHDQQDMLISNVMALIAVYMRKDYYAFTHKTWNIHKRKDLMDLNQQIPFCRIYQWTAQTTGVMPMPNVYLKRDEIVPMRNGNLEPPAFIVGPALFQNAPDREVAFTVGKQLALGRPEHYLSSGFFPTENLKVLFMGAMQLTNPALNLGQGNQEFMDVIQKMNKIMPPPVAVQLRGFMQKFFKTGANPNLSAWRKAIDHTTNRVGLLMCGDLLTAANCIKNEQVPVSKLTAKEKIKELVLFSISEEYFQLRKELGLALRAQ